MTRPRVTFVAPAAYPLGGVATWLDRLVPDLRAQGLDARVLLTVGRHHAAGAYRRAHPAIEPAAEVRSATSTPESRVQALAVAISAAADPARPHVVVSVNIPDAMLAVARLRDRGGAGGLRAAMSIHGLEPDLYADLERLAPLVDGVICSNRLAAARATLAPGLAAHRVHYAPYGTGLPAAPARPADGSFTVGFAGRFECFQKRIQDLEPVALALAREGVTARWLVAGSGPDARQVAAFAERLPEQVERLGSVAPEHMARVFYRRCHVLLNTSAWETGPIVVWEAMAHGVAVVSSRYTGSGREAALEDGVNCLLYDVGDVDAAARSLQRMTDPALRERLVTGAAELVRTRYSPEASCAAWATALTAVAEEAPRTAPEPALPASGRLDRWLGARLAERLRATVPGRDAARDPGDEWPHTHQAVRRDDPAHWTVLRALDSAAAEGGTS